MRVVIDTNVLISAIFWSGRPKQLLHEVRRGHVTFLSSEPLLSELREILTRNDKPFNLSSEAADHVIRTLSGFAEIVTTVSHITACADEADNRVLECAVDGGAEYIVTGDQGLLNLRYFRGAAIVSVAEAFRHLPG